MVYTLTGNKSSLAQQVTPKNVSNVSGQPSEGDKSHLSCLNIDQEVIMPSIGSSHISCETRFSAQCHNAWTIKLAVQQNWCLSAIVFVQPNLTEIFGWGKQTCSLQCFKLLWKCAESDAIKAEIALKQKLAFISHLRGHNASMVWFFFLSLFSCKDQLIKLKLSQALFCA